MSLPSWEEISKNINTLPSWEDIELSINKKEEELPSWEEIETKISTPDIEKPTPPKQLQDIAKIMPKPTEEAKPTMGAEYIPAKVYSTLIEKPVYAMGELSAKLLKTGFNAIGLKNVGEYFAESEEMWKKPPVTEKVQEQTNYMRQNAYGKGMSQGVAFDVTEATTQLMGLLTQMAVTKQLPAFKDMGLSGSVKAMATHAIMTTPGDIDDRLQSALFRVAYSITPFIANSTGATGITAVAVDTLLNTFLTSPTYIKALKEAENPEQFLSMAIPQLVMDIGMAWNTRGLPANQQRVMIDKYMKGAEIKFNLTKDEYIKAVDIVSKMESKPAELVKEEVKFKSEIITPKTPTEKVAEVGKELFEKSYAYTPTEEGHKFKVIRAGEEYSHPSRGGTWYDVEKWEGQKAGYLEGQGQYGVIGVGGKETFRKEITLKNPYMFEIPEIKAEGEIPIKLWEKVTGNILSNKKGFFGKDAEKHFTKLEKEVSDTLKEKGYDGVVLYEKVGINTYPKQIFNFIEPKAPAIPAELEQAKNALNNNQIYIDNQGNYRWQDVGNWKNYWEIKEDKTKYEEAFKQKGKIVPFNKEIKKNYKSFTEFYNDVIKTPTTPTTEKPAVVEAPAPTKEKLISPMGTIEGEKGSMYIPSMKEVQDLGTKLKSLIDIEAPFKKAGAKETGFQLKNYYSNIGMSHEQALGEINKLNKAGIGNVSAKGSTLKVSGKIDYADLTFATENPTYAAKLTPEERNIIQPASKIITNYYNKWETKLKEIGWMTEPFPQSLVTRSNRKIGNLKASLDNIKGIESRAKVKAEINNLQDKVKRIESQNIKFVSIPAKAILAKAENDPQLNQKLMSIMPHWGRETVTVKDLVNVDILTRQEADARFILGEYSDRIGRKYALGKIFENAEKEGLIASQVEKPDWPTARIYVNGQSVSIPQMRGKRLDPFFSDMITHFFSKDQVTLKGLFGVIKMMQFYNPAIMPMYDVWQSAAAGTFLNPVKGAEYIATGIEDVIKKTDNYWSAYENGTFSKPYVIPYDKWEYQFKEAMKGNKFGEFLKKAALPLNWIPMAYNASWQTAWTLDPMVRMMTFNYLLDKGMTPREAGQMSALFHSDYASVPPATRKALNKVFFTPTFKITMGKLYANMLKGGGKVLTKGMKATTEEKILARGGLLALAGMTGISMFFTNQGYKEIEKFRKYSKEVETDEGMKENVITLANPFNIPYRYYYRVKNAWNPSNLNVAQKLIDTFKWDLHPIWRVGYDIIENKNYSIYNPFDESKKVAFDLAKYATGEFVKITKGLLESAESGEFTLENFKALQKDMGKLKAIILKPFIFNYLRAPEIVRESWQKKSLEKEFRYIQYVRPSDDPKVNYERLQEFYKRLMEISNP